MATRDKFPLYATHDDASCHNCGGDFRGGYWLKSKYPQGRGQFVCYCDKCGLGTWYDVITDKEDNRT